MSLKILFTTDRHRTSVDIRSGSYFPGHLDKMNREKATALYSAYCRATEFAYNEGQRFARENGPFDIHISLGDETGGWQEKGLADPSVIRLATDSHEVDKKNSARVHKCFGNHDTGYNVGGIQNESLKACEKISSLYWKDEISGFVFIGVCSPLAEYMGQDYRILDLKRKQELFVLRALREKGNKKWIFCSHDPHVAKHMSFIEPYLGTLEHFVFGDKHSIAAGRVEKLRGMIPVITPRIVRQTLSKGILIPSIAPVWWEGHMLATGTLSEDGLKLRRVRLPRSKDSVKLPTNSPIRSYYWMKKFEMKHMLQNIFGPTPVLVPIPIPVEIKKK
ncbi:hypothetical protein KW783_02155 [Candidatus Parcubacteria bacterium]|nr:hypothetical protein [Candidatus Parcubacteria bacterium]